MNYYANNVAENTSHERTKICYQVDFNAVAVGKVIAMSKRRIRWRFGFPNQEALNAGKSGIDCRGEEHDVTLVWSVTSGKRLLMSNNQQIYIGTNKSKMFEYTWYDKNGTNLRIVAHSAQPMVGVSGCRQYDLFVDGKSFFTLPKVYEIGLRGSVQEGRVPGVITNNDRLRLELTSPYRSDMHTSAAEQEQADLKRAIEASLQESRAHLASRGRLDDDSVAASTLTNTVDGQYAPVKAVQEDQPLIDFLSDPAPVPASDSQALVPIANTLQTDYQLQNPFNYSPQQVISPPMPSVATDAFAPSGAYQSDVSRQYFDPLANHHSAASNPFDTMTTQVQVSDQHNYAFPQQHQSNNIYGSQPPNANYHQTQQQPQPPQQPAYQTNYYGNYQM